MKRASYFHLIDKFKGTHSILQTQIGITNRCNEKCVHCYVCKETPAELPYALIKTVIKQLRTLQCFSINLTGGDPFLHKDLFRIIEDIRMLNMGFSINTNGILITPAVAKRLQSLRPHFIQISLYGIDAKTHDGITRLPGSFLKTKQALELLSALNVPLIIAQAGMRSNFQQTMHIRQFAKKINAEHIFDPIVRPREDLSKEPLQYRLTNSQIKKGYVQKLFSFVDLNKPRRKQTKKTAEEKSRLGRSLHINAHGEVWPSALLPLPAGNIYTLSLLDIWYKSPLFQRIRALTNKDFTCWKCRYYRYCCAEPCLAYTEHKDLLARPLEFCRILSIITKDRNINRWIQKN